MTIPDIDDLSSLGGVKENYGPIVDPLTDLDADQDNRSRADVAGMTHTAVRAVRQFIGAASSPPTEPSSNSHDAVWGNDVGVKPTIVRNSAGYHTITWPAEVTTELGETVALNFRWAHAVAHGSTAFMVNCGVVTANTVDVRIFDAAGAAADGVGTHFTVFVY